MNKQTISRQTMELACGGVLGDRLTFNARKLVLELQSRGVTQGDVRHECGRVVVYTEVNGRSVTIVVSDAGFDLDAPATMIGCDA